MEEVITTVTDPRWKLPSMANWYHGDCVFLAPDDVLSCAREEYLDSLVGSGRASGLSWMIIYGVEEDAPLPPPPGREEAGFAFVPARLVSVMNRKGRIVRMLVVDSPRTGSESCESPRRLHDVICQDMKSFAVGPFKQKAGLIARLLSKVGIWLHDDLAALSGVKVSAGADTRLTSAEFWEARHLWLQLLLAGNQSFIMAGSDVLPGFSNAFESRAASAMYGVVRTVAYCPHGVSVGALVTAIGQGSLVVTNGPMVAFSMANEQGQRACVGGSLCGNTFSMSIRAKSSPEFGDFRAVDVIVGDVNRGEEEIRASILRRHGSDMQDIESSIDEVRLTSGLKPGARGYVRIEAESEANGQVYFAMTNAILLSFAGNGHSERSLESVRGVLDQQTGPPHIVDHP